MQNPALPPFPIPDFPDSPPIPSPPCFKLFGIPSIDCPLDKGKPTTTFSAGPHLLPAVERCEQSTATLMAPPLTKSQHPPIATEFEHRHRAKPYATHMWGASVQPRTSLTTGFRFPQPPAPPQGQRAATPLQQRLRLETTALLALPLA